LTLTCALCWIMPAICGVCDRWRAKLGKTSENNSGGNTVDKERLEALLEEATVDCYGVDEEFTGVMCTLGEELRFPLKATVVGELVEVVGIDERRSSLGRGVVARVRRKGQDYQVGLAELEFVDPDPTSEEWLEAYRYWLSLG
jgi:hypothetical protein